ncbi:MAG TPA: hypothetical protein PKE12_03235 [Kiritimatiellia bacterium]|nr:hypothetical protein [Kiritimatiellia bacterium]
MTRGLRIACVGAALAILAASWRVAAAPALVDYQGKLADAAGNPVDGDVSMVFRIWTDASGGTLLWVETQAVVRVDNGLFHVLLGAENPLREDTFDEPGRALSVQVGTDDPLEPRIPIASAPHAMSANRAANATWADQAASAATTPYATRAGTASTAGYATNAGQAAAATYATTAGYATNAGYAATAGSAPPDDDWVVAGTNLHRLAGNVGIGTASPVAPLHVHRATGNLETHFTADAGSSYLRLSGATNAFIDFQRSGISKGQVGYSHIYDTLFMFNGGWVVLKGGNLGVGNQDPQARLHVSAGSAFIDGNLGVGTTNPLAKVHVEGTLRVDQRIQADDAGGLEFATSNGTIRMQMTDAGRIGIGTTEPRDLLHVYKLVGNLRPEFEAWGGDVDLVLNSATNNPTVEFQNNGTFGASVGFDISKNYAFLYHGGAVVVKNGRLGIGTNNPSTSLEVNGTVKVTGECQGTFPRPNYDSGWLDYSKGEGITLVHNLGGNMDNYVVDIQARDPSMGWGTHAVTLGGDAYDNKIYGFWFRNLTTSNVVVRRGNNDEVCSQIRLRIWVYN